VNIFVEEVSFETQRLGTTVHTAAGERQVVTQAPQVRAQLTLNLGVDPQWIKGFPYDPQEFMRRLFERYLEECLRQQIATFDNHAILGDNYWKHVAPDRLKTMKDAGYKFLMEVPADQI
jgi:hypothetical protein